MLRWGVRPVSIATAAATLAVLATALAAAAASMAPAGASAAALVPLAPASAWDSPPIHGASPPGDPRFFVVERGGGIRIVENGVPLSRPFLTVPNVDTSGERGLLSIAFAPDYATSGFFYVFAVAKAPDAFGGSAGDLRVLEYRRSAGDPDLADPASARLVLAQEHPGADNHNGGQLAFGPEGLLYVTMGDGGASPANSQTKANLLGKILRIDPRGGFPYAVPFSNPFVGEPPPVRPEIYALGLRNPYRFSFAPNGDLVLPDVGGSSWEEVNVGKAIGTEAATTLAGANLGWPSCEGACIPANQSFVDPIFQYPHSGGFPCWAIIGGHVVRDPDLVGLTGRYLYGDTCAPDLRSLDLAAPGADPRPAGPSILAEEALLGFGEDAKGCSYAMTTSTVYRLAAGPDAGAACPGSFDSDGGGFSPGQGAGAGGSKPAADKRPPKLRLKGARRLRLGGPIHLSARCDEACDLSASGSLAFGAGVSGGAAGGARTLAGALGLANASVVSAAGALRTNHASVAANATAHLTLRLKGKATRRARRHLRRGHSVTLRLGVAASDRAGNASSRSLSLRLVPPAAWRRSGAR